MKSIYKLIIMLTITALFLSACSSHTLKTNDKLTAAVSIIPQETFVKKVAGDLVDVITVIPPGKSPANYAPSPQDIEKLSHASIYFTIGVPSEQSSILPRLMDINKDIIIKDMAYNVNRHYSDIELSPGQRDPHIWLSPKRCAIMVEDIAQELSAIDNGNADIYHTNAQDYIEKLRNLDMKINDLISSIKNKAFIIYHPSLGYFADDYGLAMVSIQSGGKDATPYELKRAIDIAKNSGIKSVLYQAEIDSKQSQVFASEIGGKAVIIAPLDPDYINNMENIAELIAGSSE